MIPPKQYGAGEVIVWDCGVYSPDEAARRWFHDRERRRAARCATGSRRASSRFQLRGEKLKGSFALVKTKEAKASGCVIKHKDRFVTTDDVTARDRSILSGASVEDLKIVPAHRIAGARGSCPRATLEPMPAKLAPMLAEIGDAAVQQAPTGCGSRSSTATACSRSSTRTAK